MYAEYGLIFMVGMLLLAWFTQRMRYIGKVFHQTEIETVIPCALYVRPLVYSKKKREKIFNHIESLRQALKEEFYKDLEGHDALLNTLEKLVQLLNANYGMYLWSWPDGSKEQAIDYSLKWNDRLIEMYFQKLFEGCRSISSLEQKVSFFNEKMLEEEDAGLYSSSFFIQFIDVAKKEIAKHFSRVILKELEEGYDLDDYSQLESLFESAKKADEWGLKDVKIECLSRMAYIFHTHAIKPDKSMIHELIQFVRLFVLPEEK